MKYLTVLFWSLVLGQVLGYILSALQGTPDNIQLVAIGSVFFAGFVILLAHVMKPKTVKK